MGLYASALSSQIVQMVTGNVDVEMTWIWISLQVSPESAMWCELGTHHQFTRELKPAIAALPLRRQDRRGTLRECEPQGRFGEELREVVELWPGTGIGAELVGLESNPSH